MTERFNTFFSFIPRDLNKPASESNKNVAEFIVDNKDAPIGSKYNVHVDACISNFSGATLGNQVHDELGVVGTYKHKFPLGDYDTVESFILAIGDYDGTSTELYTITANHLVNGTTTVQIANTNKNNGLLKGFTTHIYKVEYSNGHGKVEPYPDGDVTLTAGSGEVSLTGTIAKKEGFFVSQVFIQIIDKDI